MVEKNINYEETILYMPFIDLKAQTARNVTWQG